MNIVSGVATANGISPLLNAPRTSPVDVRSATGEAAKAVRVAQTPTPSRSAESSTISRPVLGNVGVQENARPEPRNTTVESRYKKFVQAVMALRGDFGTMRPPDSRIAAMKASADEIFMLGDGIPGEVEPPVIGELKVVGLDTATSEPGAAAKAEKSAQAEDEALTIPEPVFSEAAETDQDPVSGEALKVITTAAPDQAAEPTARTDSPAPAPRAEPQAEPA